MFAAAVAVLAAPVAGYATMTPASVLQAVAGTADISGWAAKVWDAARKGDQAEIDQLLANRPDGLDPDGRLGKAIALYQSNVAAREAKRAEEIKRVSAELDTTLAEQDGGDLAVSQALRSAVELHMLATDKSALMNEPRIKDLVTKAEAAARAAEQRGDWLTASELYYRLDLLLEDRGTFRDDVKRESQRLAMIRLYNPQRLWELRNERRLAEIAWDAKHKTDTKEPEEGTAAAAARQREKRPLPPYNPVGDDFREKLEGIDENMVQGAIGRSFARHVERTSMDKILKNGLDALRVLVTTEDLKNVFPGVADPKAREAFLNFLDAETDKLARANVPAGMPDLTGLLIRLPDVNDKTVKLPRSALLHEFGNGAMTALDEFSAIIWPDEIRRFNRNTQARFKGVGIQIELDPMSNIKVVTPLEGTPAQRAGVRPGDLIKKVDGKPTEGFTLDQAVDVITGPADTKVTLTLEREITDDSGQKRVVEIDVPLKRAEIPVTTVKGWKKAGPKEDAWDWFVDPQDKIGYVRLTQFADKTDDEFDRAIDQMKTAGLKGLILDLRYNPGGLLDQAVAVTSRFVDRGKTKSNNGMVVTTHTKDNTIVQQERILQGAAKLAGIPIVVLINEGSASASEIVSGALQDYAASGDIKAILLGGRSYGKGSVQNVWQLAGGADAAVKVTTQYYHLPGGRMIHRLPSAERWGVEPNLKVDMLPSQMGDSLLLRQNADVLKIDENGKLTTTEPTANPDDLVNKSLDLQLQQAILLLQAESAAAAATKALVEKPTSPKTN
jgi:carboxyl-terminal processing protease